MNSHVHTALCSLQQLWFYRNYHIREVQNIELTADGRGWTQIHADNRNKLGKAIFTK